MYQYVLDFTGPCPLKSTISIEDASASNFSAVQAIKPAAGSGATSVWVSTAAIPPISRPLLDTQAVAIFLFQELVNGVLQIVQYAGLVDFATNGVVTLSCSHPYTGGRFCGWQAFNFDFTRV